MIDLTINNAYEAVYRIAQDLEEYGPPERDVRQDWISLLEETRRLFYILKAKIEEGEKRQAEAGGSDGGPG